MPAAVPNPRDPRASDAQHTLASANKRNALCKVTYKLQPEHMDCKTLPWRCRAHEDKSWLAVRAAAGAN